MAIVNGSSNNGSQSPTIIIALPPGKDARNIVDVTVDNGIAVAWSIINDNQISVSLANGGGHSVQTGTTTEQTNPKVCSNSSTNASTTISNYGLTGHASASDCSSTVSYNNGSYAGTLSYTGYSSSGGGICYYGGTAYSLSCPSSNSYNDGTYSGTIPYTSGDGTSTCNYSGTLYETTTVPVYSTYYQYDVTVRYAENNSHSYHTTRLGKNGRGVIT